MKGCFVSFPSTEVCFVSVCTVSEGLFVSVLVIHKDLLCICLYHQVTRGTWLDGGWWGVLLLTANRKMLCDVATTRTVCMGDLVGWGLMEGFVTDSQP